MMEGVLVHGPNGETVCADDAMVVCELKRLGAFKTFERIKERHRGNASLLCEDRDAGMIFAFRHYSDNGKETGYVFISCPKAKPELLLRLMREANIDFTGPFEFALSETGGSPSLQ